MSTSEKNKSLISDFIEMIWNRNKLEKIDEYIHPEFIDHSLPLILPANKEGLMGWVISASKSFIHRSEIKEHVTEGDKSIIKLCMHLEHIGVWRDVQPTGAKISVAGYRCFRIQDGKIIEHWALVDGNSLENQLKHAANGCKPQE